MVSLGSLGSSRRLNSNFQKATDRVAQAIERLSSGNRLNSVKDGAVDYAKFRGLQAQSRGLSQVLGQVGDTRGLTEKADSTLSAMMQMAFDLRELAQRATNEGLTTTEREELQAEADSIISDFSSYAADTSYNTFKLLDGSFGTKSLQNGLSANSNFSFGLGDARTITLGKIATMSGSTLSSSVYIGDGTTYGRLNGVYVPAGSDDGISSNYGDRSAISLAAAINSVSDQSGVYAEAVETSRTLYFSDSGSTFNDTLDAGDFTINGVAITGSGVDTTTELITAINNQSESTGVIASLDSSGNISLEASDGRNIQVEISNASGNNFYDAVNLSVNSTILGSGWSNTYSTGANNTNIGAIEIWSSEAIHVLASSTNAFGIASATNIQLSGSTSLQALDLESVDAAELAIKTLDTTITQISSMRANIASVHSRLDSSASKLIQDIDVTDQAAQSLGGADFALETANLVYNQLIQNSALASIIQANVSRVTVSKLLSDL